LDELVMQRDAPEPTAEPVLTIDPVAVPPAAAELGRRAAKQRIAALESAARRNLRSAEEARRALFEEHQRLQQESSARAQAQGETAALRREIERLRSSDDKRAAQVKTRAKRAAREEIAEEIKHYHDEHDRVVHELDRLRGTLTEHDGLLEEYGQRLRDEQQTVVALRAELERTATARELAERALEHAIETARKRAEDELIHLATLETELSDLRSDRDRLQKQIAELTSDGAVAKLRTDIEARDAEIAREHETIARLEARIADAEDEAVRARADGDRLREHAAALGNELAALRSQVAELQAAAPAPAVREPSTDRPPLERRHRSPSPVAEEPAAPPLPMRRAPAAVAPAASVAESPHDSLGIAEPPNSRPGEVLDELPVELPAAAESVAASPAPSAAPTPPMPDGFRRTAMAELTAIAAADDFTFRRR
jgi:chromosome segregation ATPase